MAGEPVHRLSLEQLAVWYREQSRELPWRSDPTPYHVLLSEFMCQQTRVETALPYFERFRTTWPTLEALAAASEAEVTEAWAGLGYYSRARRLLACAQAAVEAGGMPETVEGLRALPGIGPYTAGAIASIAFAVPTPAVDGNVQRVLSRWLTLQHGIDTTAGRDALEQTAVAWHDTWAGHPGDLNQALMELGARICTPKRPRCSECPLQASCAAAEAGTASDYPRKRPRTPPKLTEGVVVVALHGDQVLLVRPPSDQLLGGLWGPPFAFGAVQDVLPGILAALGPCGPVQSLGSLRHVFSHRDFRAEVLGVDVPALTEGRWVPLRDPGPGLSTLARNALQVAHDGLVAPSLFAADVADPRSSPLIDS